MVRVIGPRLAFTTVDNSRSVQHQHAKATRLQYLQKKLSLKIVVSIHADETTLKPIFSYKSHADHRGKSFGITSNQNHKE